MQLSVLYVLIDISNVCDFLAIKNNRRIPKIFVYSRLIQTKNVYGRQTQTMPNYLSRSDKTNLSSKNSENKCKHSNVLHTDKYRYFNICIFLCPALVSFFSDIYFSFDHTNISPHSVPQTTRQIILLLAFRHLKLLISIESICRSLYRHSQTQFIIVDYDFYRCAENYRKFKILVIS